MSTTEQGAMFWVCWPSGAAANMTAHRMCPSGRIAYCGALTPKAKVVITNRSEGLLLCAECAGVAAEIEAIASGAKS